MKANIHPNYHADVTVTCTCGNTFTTGSIKDKIQVDICAACHPFFTGEVRYIDLAGRVDKFLAKTQAAQQTQKAKKDRKQQTAAPQSLKEMLQSIKKQSSGRPATSSSETSTAN